MNADFEKLENEVKNAKAALDAAREAAMAARERLEKVKNKHAAAIQSVKECAEEVNNATEKSKLAMATFIDEEGTQEELEVARNELSAANGRLKTAKRLADALAAEMEEQDAKVKAEPPKTRDLRNGFWAAVARLERARLIQVAGDGARRFFFLDKLGDVGAVKTSKLSDAVERAFLEERFEAHERLAAIEALEREYGDLYPGMRK